jgi:hypothetical protein
MEIYLHMYKHRRTYTCSVVWTSCTLPTTLYQELLTYCNGYGMSARDWL